jgi:hypothetical protein
MLPPHNCFPSKPGMQVRKPWCLPSRKASKSNNKLFIFSILFLLIQIDYTKPIKVRGSATAAALPRVNTV